MHKSPGPLSICLIAAATAISPALVVMPSGRRAPQGRQDDRSPSRPTGWSPRPYEAQDAAALIREADNRLMHGAKKRGKNSLMIVGTDEPMFPPEQAKP